MTKPIPKLEATLESIGFKRPTHRKPGKNLVIDEEMDDDYDTHAEEELARLRKL